MEENVDESDVVEDVKMKSGLEIHQQLDTHKLYCNCPSILQSSEPVFEVTRRLHAVKGEKGEVDVAALHEAGIDKQFVYQGYDTTCLVELDEEPPHLINKEALKIALHISMHLNCKIVPITQIMRKTVVDGSNTSGFQRTVLIARDGFIQTPDGRVGISQVYLEEDAARNAGEKDGKKVYRLDRLGIPLVEVVTAPDIKYPEQARDVALQIGDILRSCKVRRGIGTIRQDINLSTPNHPRVEIKGFQDPKTFVDVVLREVKRQQKSFSIKNDLKGRNASVSEEIVDLTDILKSTKCSLIKKVLSSKESKVLGFKLNQFDGFLGMELCPGRRLGTEISDYARKAGVKGLIHSDENLSEKYAFNNDEIALIKKRLKLKKGDAFILIADEEQKASDAISRAIKRAKMQISDDFPLEVRGAKQDCSTQFLRPLSGVARMYPETDLPLLKIKRKDIEEAKTSLPKLRGEIRSDLKEKGLTDEMIKLFAHGDKVEEFTVMSKLVNDPNFVARAMFLIPKEIATKEQITDIDSVLTLDVIEHTIKAVSENKISQSDVKQVYLDIVKGKSFSDAINIEKADLSEVESEIAKIIKAKPGLSIGGYMGLVMAKFKGKISGNEANKILQKLIN